MKKINKLDIMETSYKIFENIVNSKTGDNKIILNSVSAEIKNLYENFSDNETELFPMVPYGYSGDTHKALLHCFNDIIITKNYKARLKSLENRKCPYCFLELSSQVEHYLPKEEFPEFAFMIDNLFPCCGTCNSKKGEAWKDATSRIILNLYHDSIPNEQFLYVKLNIIENIPTAKFEIRTSAIVIDSNVEIILNKHVKRLNLLNRYAETINDKVSELRNRVKYNKVVNKNDVEILCKSEADIQRQTYGNNYYSTVLYDEIANNDEIIKFLVSD